ncbi:GPI-anchored wall transfer protein 1 [Anthophora plagiata]
MSNVWNKNIYRQEKEAFVSGHGGTTSREVIITLMPNICSILLTTTTMSLLGRIIHKNIRVLLEFALIVIPCILCCTILSEYIVTVCCAMMVISVINILLLGINSHALSTYNIKSAYGKRPFITNFRALTNIITAVCILAIDFHIFPRKFSKTEVFGYSLMDTGVGLFILSNALVAPEAKDFAPRFRTGFFLTISKNIKHSARSCIPLLILGFGRSVAIEVLGYQKHITEYGIHWNFFITLAFVKLFTSSITSTINSRYSLLSGIWILGMHEYILSTKGLKEWVLSDRPRNDFVSANREGVVSVPGYVGLYLIGVAVGRLIHSTYQNLHAQNSLQHRHKTFHMKLFGYEFDASYNESMILCIKLSLISAQTCAATLFCDSYFRVSRRLANAGYCMWILTLGVMVLTLLLLTEILTDILIHATTDSDNIEKKTRTQKIHAKHKRENVSDDSEKNVTDNTIEIFEAVNYNGLLFFFLSNLMTGGINMLVRTLHVNQLRALQILIAYMAVNITSVLLLYRKQVQIKL